MWMTVTVPIFSWNRQRSHKVLEKDKSGVLGGGEVRAGALDTEATDLDATGSDSCDFTCCMSFPPSLLLLDYNQPVPKKILKIKKKIAKSPGNWFNPFPVITQCPFQLITFKFCSISELVFVCILKSIPSCPWGHRRQWSQVSCVRASWTFWKSHWKVKLFQCIGHSIYICWKKM